MTEKEAMAKYGKLVLEAIKAAGRHNDDDKHPQVILAFKQVKAMNTYIRKHFPQGGLVKNPDKVFSDWQEEYAE